MTDRTIQKFDAETTSLVTLVEGVEIATADDFSLAGDLVKVLSAKEKEIDGLRKTAVDPLNAQVKAVNDMFRPSLERLRGLKVKVKGLMERYIIRQRAEQARLLRAVVAAPVEAHAEATAALVAATEAAPPKVQGISTRSVWAWEVTNPGAVPEEFTVRMVDSAKVDAAVAAGARSIPGLRIYEHVIVTARTG